MNREKNTAIIEGEGKRWLEEYFFFIFKMSLQWEVVVYCFVVYWNCNYLENGQKGATAFISELGWCREGTTQNMIKGCLMLIALFIVLLAHCKLFEHNTIKSMRNIL